MGKESVGPGFLFAQRYRVETTLGPRSTAKTYLCRDLKEGDVPVILKLLATAETGEDEAHLLRQQFSLLTRLRHPNLVRLLDLGTCEEKSSFFLVEEYIQGKDLFQASESWSEDAILSLLAQLCRILQFLHGRRIFHGKLKSSNILVTEPHGDGAGVKLLDFGLAKWIRGRQLFASGTSAYAAPEILLGRSPTAWSDLYSLGILAYRLLARRLPFDADDRGYLVQKHLQGRADMRPIERLDSGPGLVQVLTAMLEKDPAKRPSSAEEVLRLLSAASGRDFSGLAPIARESYFSAGQFVGRELEMKFLQERAARSRESGRGSTVYLAGESGSGKSRCMEELRIWALLSGWRVIEGRCSQREDRPYGPYRQILAETGRLSGADSASSEEGETFRFEDVPRVAETAAYEIMAESAAGQFRDQLTREIIRRLSGRPTMLFLHDYHWADEATAAVLGYLTTDIQAHPIFMCVSLRPGEAAQGPVGRVMEQSNRQLRSETVTLEALAPPAMKDLVVSMVGEAPLGKTIAPWIYKASGGNPFFAEEILKHLVDRGLLHRELGRWTLQGTGIESMEVPATIAVVLRERLATLSAPARKAIHWFALINRALSKDLLRDLDGGSPSSAESILDELLSRQIIQSVAGEAGELFDLRHALIAEVIRSDMSKDRRRRLHRRIADVLEQRQGPDEDVQELAKHFTEGIYGDKAIRYALQAASLCRAEFANEAALRFYEYILSHKNTLSQEQLCEVAIDASETCCALGNPKLAVKYVKNSLLKSDGTSIDLKARLWLQLASSYRYSSQMSLMKRSANKGLNYLTNILTDQQNITKARLLNLMAYLSLVQSRPLDALRSAKKALAAIDKTSNKTLEGKIYIMMAASQRVACNYRGALAAAKKALDVLESCKAIPLLTLAYSHVGTYRSNLGRYRLAIQSHQKARVLSDRARSLTLRSQALGNLGECLCRSGRIKEANLISEELYRIGSDSGNPLTECGCIIMFAEIKLTEGNYLQSQFVLEKLNTPTIPDIAVYMNAYFLYVSAWLNVELGNYASASRHIDNLEKLSAIKGPFYEDVLCSVLKARIHYYQGNHDKALEILFLLEKLMIKKRWPYHLCIVNLRLAEILLTKGELPGARKQIRNALRLSAAMPCIHFQAQSHLLFAILHFRSFSAAIDEASRESSGADLKPNLLHQAGSELTQALRLAEESGMDELIWRAHYEMARLEELLADFDACALHAGKALECLQSLENRVPPEMLQSYRSVPDRARALSECCRLMAKFRAQRESAELALGEIEAGHLRTLFRASNALNSIRDLSPLLDAIVTHLVPEMGVECAAVFLHDKGSARLRQARVRNARDNSAEAHDSIDINIVDQVHQKGTPFVSANAAVDPRLTGGNDSGCRPSGTVFCAPLSAGGKSLGVLYADHSSPRDNLTESTINLFAAFCNIAATAIDNALAHRQLIQEKAELQQRVHHSRGAYSEIIGESPAMDRLRERIALIAGSPLDALVTGESGTGKELVAKALHRTGRRASGKFVPLDCGSLSDSLVESELFGYRRGAFTGANENRPGLLEAANGGVFVLDEVGNLALKLQGKLLRALQEREVRRIGETQPRKIDVTIIAITNMNLLEEAAMGRFRNDLYFRLASAEIHVPALRERSEDVPLLLDYFLDKYSREEGGRKKIFSPQALEMLTRYRYPGNVRELINIVRRSYYLCPDAVIDVENLPSEVRSGEREAVKDQESETIARRIYEQIRRGKGNFDDLVREPFKKRQLGKSIVRHVIHLALQDTEGRYRNALRLMGCSAKGYSSMMTFLKRNDCYLDYRPYRKGAGASPGFES